MKNSILLAIAILALGAVPVFYQKHRLAALRDESRQLLRQARQLGIHPSAEDPTAASPQTKRQRQDRAGNLAQISAEIAAFAERNALIEARGGEPDADSLERGMELMDRLAKLDAAGLRQVIRQLREGTDQNGEKARARIIAFSLLTLAEQNPQGALAVYAECSDWIGKSEMGGQTVLTALDAWARQDPHAASEWLEKNAAKHPEISATDATDSLLSGAARCDPQMAFRMLDRLAAEDPEAAVQAIAATAEDSPEQRDAVLAALRSHLAGIGDADQRAELRSKALETMARALETQDFSAITGWISTQRFSPEEMADFAGGLSYFTTKQQSGQWIDWLAGKLPEDQLADPVREIVSEWTQQDYLTAGTWLSGAPESPAKAAAIEAYAEAVAEYEPQVAEQWALTLPPGSRREAALRAVHENWPAADPAGAEAFARKYQLEP